MSHRTQVILDDDQYEALLRESRRHGVSLAELVRRAVDRTYGRRGDRAADRAALEASFGSWTGRDFDGHAYVESHRKGMARRLEPAEP